MKSIFSFSPVCTSSKKRKGERERAHDRNKNEGPAQEKGQIVNQGTAGRGHENQPGRIKIIRN